MKRSDYWTYGALFVAVVVVIALLASLGQQSEKKRMEREMNACLYDVEVVHRGIGFCRAYYDEQGVVHIERR